MMNNVFKSLIITTFTALAAFAAKAQDCMDIKNHVIIAVDNAGCSWAKSDAVRDEVVRTLYNFRHDSVKDSLLKHDDYFSIVTFQARIDYPDNLLISRYATSENNCKYLSMPPYDLMNYLNSEWENISYHSLGTAYSLVSIAKAYALSAVQTNTYKTNRTFLVMVTDHHYNGNDFYDEVNNFAHDNYRTHQLRLTFDKPAFFQKSYDVNQEYYIRYLDTKTISGSYEGNHYKGYIEIYEYLPLQQFLSLSSVVDFPLTVKAKRRPGRKYEAKVDFICRPDNPHYNIEKLEVSADNGQAYTIFSHRDTVLFDSMISRSNKPDSLKVRAWLDLNDGVYGATVLTPSPDAPDYLGRNGLSVQIPIEYEKDAKVLGFIPLFDLFWPACIKSQSLAAWLWSLILLGLGAALILWDFRKKNNYSPALDEFYYKPNTMNENIYDMKYEIRSSDMTGFSVTLGGNGELQQIHTATFELEKRDFFRLKPLLPNEKVRLSTKINEYNDIILDETKPVFLLQRKGEQNAEATFQMKENKEFITLLFNPIGIADSTRKESHDKDNDLFTIKYDLVLETLNLKDEVKEVKVLLKDQEFKFTINELPIIKPKYSIEPASGRLEYSNTSDGYTNIGALVITPDIPFLYQRCPALDIRNLTITPMVHGKAAPSGIYMCGFQDRDVQAGLRCSLTSGVFDTEASIENMLVTNTLKVPLFIDMKLFDNPTEMYDEITLRICSSCNKSIDRGHEFHDQNEKIMIKLFKNNDIVKLVETVTGTEHEPVRIDLEKDSPLKMYVPTTFGLNRFSIDFRNNATIQGRGYVYIMGMNLTFDSHGRSVKSKLKSTNDIFKLEDKAGLLNQGIHELKNGEMASLAFTYRASDISSIKNGSAEEFESTVDIKCSYKYFEDIDGAFMSSTPTPSAFVKRHTIVLPVRIKRIPENQKWLCVDFGTSAVVASYGTGSELNGNSVRKEILDLSKNKSLHINKSFTESPDSSDISETAEKMISSIITINQGKNVVNDINDYANNRFWFSPHSSHIDITHYPLPCLKSLMGHETLPGCFLPANFRNINDIKINNLFKTAYGQFFKFFLDDPNKTVRPSNTNKVIFTVPNTYSPKDIRSLKEIIRDELKESFPDYTKFISESDAVAFFYVENREAFNNNSPNLDNGYDRRVLVYDMGAGTLDLTYFEYDSENNILDIKGKMGVNKAGNYFDYAIAQAVIDLVCQKDQKISNEAKKDLTELLMLEMNNFKLTEARKLKAYVKDRVKPYMDDGDYQKKLPDAELFSRTLEFSTITVKEVLESKYVKEYLNDISEYVLSNFNRLFGSEVKPTMILFSGRSCALSLIRDKVMKSLRKLQMTGDTVYVADISSMMIEKNSIPNTLPEGVNRLKTVVIEGALAFAKMGTAAYKIKERPLYASYGLMLKKAANNYDWILLVDGNSDQDQQLPNGYLYSRKTELNLNLYSEMYLLQSFSADTKKDWMKGKKELISVIEYFDLGIINANPAGKDIVKLEIDSDKQLHITINNGTDTKMPFDDYRDDSFKKSSWPSIQRPTI